MNVNKPSREIDFRAFCKSKQRMLSCLHLKKATRGMVFAANQKLKELDWETNKLTPNGLFLPLKDDDLIFMQYIGIKDRNDKKIYEGDIIKIYAYNYDEDENFIIKYDEKTAQYILDSSDLYVSFDNVYNHEVEVIGNIYENPQLLEAE